MSLTAKQFIKYGIRQESLKDLREVTLAISRKQTVSVTKLCRIKGSSASFKFRGKLYDAVKVRKNWYLTGQYEYL